MSQAPTFAQPVFQNGPITPGHAVVWDTSCVVKDAGTSASGAISSLGLYGLGGTPFGITNLTNPNVTIAGHTVPLGEGAQAIAYSDLSSLYI